MVLHQGTICIDNGFIVDNATSRAIAKLNALASICGSTQLQQHLQSMDLSSIAAIYALYGANHHRYPFTQSTIRMKHIDRNKKALALVACGVLDDSDDDDVDLDAVDHIPSGPSVDLRALFFHDTIA